MRLLLRLLDPATTMKKQPKPEALLDQFLETIGLKRKPIAKDGLCLFRAVSEQLFLTQVYHTNLYEACRLVFVHCGKEPEKEWTEMKVMEILSMMYRRDFLIYESVGECPIRATYNNFEKKIVLCRVDENQLDSVYTMSYYQNGAICQSIVYEILYRGVFKLDSELTESVSLIREQNKKKLGLVSNRLFDTDELSRTFRDINISPRERSPKKVIPPVPYRIAKALDPCIYRNVELDIWEEEKRDLVKRSPEYRERFSTGDKCQVKSEGDHFFGYIQEINDIDNTAVVFIEEFGEKRIVPISSLKLYTHHRYHFKRRRHLFNPDLQSTPTRQNRFPCTAGSRQLDYQFVQEVDNYQPVPYSEVDNYQSQEPVYSSDSYSLGNPYYPTENGYDNPCYYTMDNVNQTTGMTTYTQSAKTNANQCYPHPQLQQYRPTSMSGPIMNPYFYGSVPQQTSCVCVPFVEGIAVKDVNMNCVPSKDFAGNDMPEINTQRFFFTSGVESYRMVCQGGPVYPVMDMNGGYEPQSQQTNPMVGNNSGQFTLRPPPMLKILSPTSSHNFQHNFSTNQNFKQTRKYQVKELPAKGSELVSSVKANGDKSGVHVKGTNVECNDSGCDSDSLGGSAHDDSFKENKKGLKVSIELEKSIDSFIASKDNEVIENGAMEETVSSSSDHGNGFSKPRAKKKYYMYGSLKLVKPIKDIPPRFLSLLSGSSAEKARCEGEPIIIPFLPPKRYHQHHHHHHSNNNNYNSNTNSDKTGNQNAGGSFGTPTNFNPEAKCFVPGQMQTNVIHDPSVVAYCYDATVKQDHIAMSLDNSVTPTNSQSSVYYGVGTQYLPIQPTNLGNGSHSNPASLSNSLLGDGSKQLSMHPSFSTGQACSTYATPSMPCPVYFTGAVPYQTGQGGYIANGGMGSDMQMYYTAYNNGSATYNLSSQIPAIQTAQ